MKIQYKIYLDNINNTFKNKNKIEDDSDLLSKFTQMKDSINKHIYDISISIKTKNTAESLSSFIKSIYYLIRDVNNGLQEMKESPYYIILGSFLAKTFLEEGGWFVFNKDEKAFFNNKKNIKDIIIDKIIKKKKKSLLIIKMMKLIKMTY